MAFSDLQQKAVSEKSIIVMKEHLQKLSPFATSFDELDGRPGEVIAIPVYDLSGASEFDADSNNYCNATETADGVTLNLDKHLVKSVTITDRQLQSTGINWAADAGKAVAEQLTRGVNKYVFGLMTETNIPLSAELNTSTKAGVAELFKTAQDNEIDPYDSVLILDAANFASVLAQLDTSVYGGTEAIRQGYIPGLFGFKGVLVTGNLPEGVNGVLIRSGALGIASRYIQPMEGAYPETWRATDDDGFTIGYRVFQNLCSGKRYLAGEVLFGAKILQPNQAIRLINAAD